jgi:hypothetical protein
VAKNCTRYYISTAMQTIKMYKPFRKSVFIFSFFGYTALIFGGTGTILAFKSGFNAHILGDWIFLILIMQGIFFILMGVARQKRDSYFVRWDDNQIQYLLPGNKEIETIRIVEITRVQLQLHEVEIQVNDTIKVLDLNNIEYKPLTRIKNYFKELQSTVADTG